MGFGPADEGSNPSWAIMKVKVCPRCKSRNIILYIPQLGNYKCRDCGYVGTFVLTEDFEVEKNDKSKKRNEKSKKSLW